jgi:TRAP-type uncharacterized transport system substrate-binding protein
MSEAVPAQAPQPNVAGAVQPKAATGGVEEAWRTGLNANAISIIAGHPSETYLEVVHDLAVVLNGETMRIMPISGMGGAQNIRDVLYLKGIDAGVTSTHMLRYFASTGDLGGALDQRIHYIAKLFVEEMHVIVGPAIKSVEDLAGKKVNFSDIGSTTQITARDVFGLLSIPVKEVNLNQADAIVRIRSGEIAGTVLFSGKPVRLFSGISIGDNLRLLTIPFTPTLENTYVPAALEADDYPNLIPKGQTVQTIGIDAVLITLNWPRASERYRRVAAFVEAFFSKFPELRKEPRHPKWQQVNLAAELPGWDRLPAAQEWLDRAKRQEPVQAQFQQFLSSRAQKRGTPALTEEAEQQLFREFLKWSAGQPQR